MYPETKLNIVKNYRIPMCYKCHMSFWRPESYKKRYF